MNAFVVICDFDLKKEKQMFCFLDNESTVDRVVIQRQLLTLEEAMKLASKLTAREPNWEYSVHRITVGPDILEEK